MRRLIISLAAGAAKTLPMSVKQKIYRLPTVARFLRRKLNQAAPDGMSLVKIAAGGLQGHWMYLNLQTEKDYWLGTYESELQSAIRELAAPGMIAYDIGANIGYITLLFGRIVGEQGAVFAFEALPQNVTRLKANIAANNLKAPIRIESSAVVDRVGPVNFMIGPSGGMGKAEGSAGRNEVEYTRSLTVPGTSLDVFVYQEGNPVPEIIKVDIEGGEVLALPGMVTLLTRARPLILLELHGPEAAKVVWETLKSVGYQVHWMTSKYPEIGDLEELNWKSYIVAKPAS